jgi:hypothetical protein
MSVALIDYCTLDITSKGISINNYLMGEYHYMDGAGRKGVYVHVVNLDTFELAKLFAILGPML